jgi:hypothetical protein
MIGEHGECKAIAVGEVSEYEHGKSFKFKGEMIITLYEDDTLTITPTTPTD